MYEILEVKYIFTPKNNESDRVLTVKVSKRLKDVTDTIKQLILDVKKLQADDVDTSDVLSRLEFSIGSLGVKVSDWKVQTRTLGSSFLLGVAPHGVTGPTFGGILGSVVASGINFLGDSRSALSIQRSGGD